MRRARKTLRTTLVATLAVGCSDAPDAGGASPLVQQGQRVYQNVCIACHNGDPTRDGAAGPAIAGATRELLEARVVRGVYPPGYTPKRAGNVMPRFEYLADQIDALAAYLAEVGQASPTPPDGPPTG